MALTDEQIRQIAHLARLEMKPEQASQYAAQLSNIFEMVNRLSGARTDGVQPMAHPLEMTQRLRPDVVSETDKREQYQEHAPAVRHGLYLVPKVIE